MKPLAIDSEFEFVSFTDPGMLSEPLAIDCEFESVFIHGPGYAE